MLWEQSMARAHTHARDAAVEALLLAGVTAVRGWGGDGLRLMGVSFSLKDHLEWCKMAVP